jgi:drug/metabolite transporter (DMT)-like permease
LWIKIGVQEVGPMSLVAFRMLFGALTAGVIAYFQGIPYTRDWKDWGIFAIFGPLSLAIPVFLISWGEQTIDSAVASILNATVPLFTLINAHFWLNDDKITFQKTLGLLIGFAGVMILLSKDLFESENASIIGQIAVILASFFYGLSAVGIRKYTTHINNVMRGVGLLTTSAILMWLVGPIFERPFEIPQLQITWIAALWLGILGSGLAMIMMYYLIHEIGPTRASLVTYLFPVGGVLLGVIFLNEQLSWQLIAGTILIIMSLAVVNYKKKTA